MTVRDIIDGVVFEEKYKGIIEIHPRKAMNSYTFNAKLKLLATTHDIVKVTDSRLRAFERRV